MLLSDLETPALILDQGRLMHNLERMQARARELGVALRPHIKTTKSARIAALATGGLGAITVSTLKEAEYFIAEGFRDITYAVGITPQKLAHVAALQAKGARLSVLLDSPAMAHEVIRTARQLGQRFSVLTEIDCGARRAGLTPGDPAIVEIAQLLSQSDGACFRGVLSHAGHAYHADAITGIERIAEDERQAVVTAAKAIEASGIPCPVRSVGSTPTAYFARRLEGITEMRPGVYMLGDIFQARLKSCKEDDIAASILATVISHRAQENFALIDAGGLALSMDRSAASRFDAHIGYGLVYDASGQKPHVGITLDTLHQEHGWLRPLTGQFPFADFPIGSKIRIFPNHSCMTAAPHNRYYVVDGGDEVIDIWDKITG